MGPLKVSGLDDPKKADFQVQVGKDIQHLLLDGAVTLYVETYALHLLVETQPSPKISFTTYVSLTFIGCRSLANLTMVCSCDVLASSSSPSS